MREDWVEVTLNDIISPEGIFCDGDWVESKDQDINGEVRLIQLADIGDGIFKNKSNRFLTDKKSVELKCTFLKQGDILIARMPEPLGRAALFPLIEEKKYVTVVDVAIIRTGHTLVNNHFLLYCINSPHIRKEIASLQSGSTRKRISRKNLSKILFPLAPLLIQRAIVGKIETLFASLDRGIADLKTAQEQLKVYRQAVLKKAFEGGFTNKNVKEGELPEGWKWVKIDSLLESEKNALKAGPFGSSLKKEFYVADGYKIYGQEQVISGNVFYGDYYIDVEKYKELISCKVKSGDILISLVGTVGKVLILPDNIKEGIINPRLIKISLDNSKYDNKFFKYYFESSTVKSIYTINASGTTMDVLNIRIIKKIPFPLPPTLTEQHAIVREIESRLSVCDKVEQSIAEALEKAEALKQSILKKAFEGRLLSEAEVAKCKQEADYEPAIELLKRIKTEKK